MIPVLPGLVLSSSACSSDSGDTARFSTNRTVKTPEQTRIPDHSDSLMNMKLNIMTDKGVVHARLYDNASAKDFIALLPLTLMLEDFNKNGKNRGIAKRAVHKRSTGWVYTPQGRYRLLRSLGKSVHFLS